MAIMNKPASKTFSRRQAISQLGMVGTVGLSKALFPWWMPRMAFRSKSSQSAPGDVLVAISLRGGWMPST